MLQVAAAGAVALQQPLTINRISRGQESVFFPVMASYIVAACRHRRAWRYARRARHPVSLDAWQQDRGDLPSPWFYTAATLKQLMMLTPALGAEDGPGAR